MRKNFIYIGVLLLVLGIAVGFFSVQSIVSSQFASPVAQQLAVNGNALGYLPIPMNQSGLAILYFNASSPVDMYFANASAFAAISGTGAKGARSAALALEGRGVYEVYLNSTSGAFPYAYGGFAKPSYSVNVTAALQSGAYYAIFLGAGSAFSSISTRSAAVPLSSINSAFGNIALYGGATIVMVLAGLILIVLGFFMKPKQKSEEGMDEEAKAAYQKLEKRRGR